MSRCPEKLSGEIVGQYEVEAAAIGVFANAGVFPGEVDGEVFTVADHYTDDAKLHVNSTGGNDGRKTGRSRGSLICIRTEKGTIQWSAVLENVAADVVDELPGRVCRIADVEQDADGRCIVGAGAGIYGVNGDEHTINVDGLGLRSSHAALGEFVIDGVTLCDQIIRGKSGQVRFCDSDGGEDKEEAEYNDKFTHNENLLF